MTINVHINLSFDVGSWTSLQGKLNENGEFSGLFLKKSRLKCAAVLELWVILCQVIDNEAQKFDGYFFHFRWLK